VLGQDGESQLDRPTGAVVRGAPSGFTNNP
jgi:hypothetical protein